MLSWRSQNSFLSICSTGSVPSIGSIGSFASVGSILSDHANFSILNRPSTRAS